MFKTTLSPTFWATVKAEVQSEDGRRVPVTFDMQYKRMTVSEIEELGKRCAEISVTDPRTGNETFLREVSVGWRYVQGDDDSTLDFSDKALGTMFELGMTVPMLAAFNESMPRAKAKN